MTTPAARLGDTQHAAIELLRATRILPVVTVGSPEQGIAVARALLAGGITAIEITLRTAAALDAIAAVKHDVAGIAVGAGTVLTPQQIDAARAAGAQFLVTPGTPPALADALGVCGLPAVPGAATPTEVLALRARGFRICKLFPASAVGGLQLVRALQAPLADVLLCPTGGIDEADAPRYLAERNVPCVGGSWMVRADWIAQGRYDLVSEAAACSLASIGTARAPD